MTNLGRRKIFGFVFFFNSKRTKINWLKAVKLIKDNSN